MCGRLPLSLGARVPFEVWLILLFIIAAAVIILPRVLPPTGPKCNRCDGTGQVHERWPDPAKPGGWHTLEGTCPKCKGKGRLRNV